MELTSAKGTPEPLPRKALDSYTLEYLNFAPQLFRQSTWKGSLPAAGPGQFWRLVVKQPQARGRNVPRALGRRSSQDHGYQAHLVQPLRPRIWNLDASGGLP